MKTIDELTEELKKLNSSLKSIVKASTYSEYDDLSGLEYDRTDPEQLFLVEEYRGILDKLESVSRSISYLQQPIAYSGKLTKQENGRYSCGEYELTSGSGLEVLEPCELLNSEGVFVDGYRWTSTRLEHNGNDYYLVGVQADSLEGMQARIRERSY